MKRIEFITELSQKLHKLPKEELESVLSYYEEIFLDAGIENEEETAKKLGNIDDIARQILADNNISPDGEPEFYVDSSKVYKNSGTQEDKAAENNKNNIKTGGMSIAAKLMIILVTCPIWIPILIFIASIAFALVVAVGAILFAFAVSGVACIAAGVVNLFIAPPLGLIVSGAGFVLLGLFGLVVSPIFKSIFRVIRKILNSIFAFFHNIIEKRRAV